MKKELWGGAFWTDGYYVGTVWECANWYSVEQYIQSQAQPNIDRRQPKLLISDNLGRAAEFIKNKTKKSLTTLFYIIKMPQVRR